MPSTVEKARTSDQTAGEGIDQPNCATELLNNKGANDWSAMLLKLLRQHQNNEQTRRGQHGKAHNGTHHWLVSKRHHARALNGRSRADATEFKIDIRRSQGYVTQVPVLKPLQAAAVGSSALKNSWPHVLRDALGGVRFPPVPPFLKWQY